MGGLFILICLKLLFIDIIFTEHDLTISFIFVTLFVSQTDGLYLILCENSKS